VFYWLSYTALPYTDLAALCWKWKLLKCGLCSTVRLKHIESCCSPRCQTTRLALLPIVILNFDLSLKATSFHPSCDQCSYSFVQFKRFSLWNFVRIFFSYWKMQKNTILKWPFLIKRSGWILLKNDPAGFIGHWIQCIVVEREYILCV
jgi:hypothetical protein